MHVNRLKLSWGNQHFILRKLGVGSELDPEGGGECCLIFIIDSLCEYGFSPPACH